MLGSLVGNHIKATRRTAIKNKLIQLAQTLHPAQLSKLATYLLKDEAISGKLIIGAVVLALLAANTGLKSDYEILWHTNLNIGLSNWVLALDLRHWVSDGLMAFFFLVVGLELKRELVHGELQKFRTAVLPFAAALGGMVVPALIYTALNLGSDSLKGWAIPTATDIALAIGLLALLGRRIPASVRLFLLTLAIIDDIVAVIVIAVFYNTSLNISMLVASLAIALTLALLQKWRRLTMPVFIVVGVVLWLTVNASGIHPSIAGALLGLLAPLTIRTRQQTSIAERAERAVIPFSTLVVVPLFAFANTGINFSTSHIGGAAAISIAGGIIIGLVVGKVVGIVGSTWLMVKFGLAELPNQATWNHIIGVGMLAGIGFTVSIFVTELAFSNEHYLIISKISIFVASVLSASIGLFALRYLAKDDQS